MAREAKVVFQLMQLISAFFNFCGFFEIIELDLFVYMHYELCFAKATYLTNVFDQSPQISF